MQIEEVTFMTEEDMCMDLPHEGQSNSNNTHVYNIANNEPVIFYDCQWLADSAMTSHISNEHDAFVTYRPLAGKTVAGIGNDQAKAIGWGTIELESIHKGNKYLLRLEDVLHIPSN